MCSRHGLGYLVAWLMEPFRIGAECGTRQEHYAFAAWLRSRAGRHRRGLARDWLLNNRGVITPSPGNSVEGLLDLERRHRPPGVFDEPEEILG